MTETHKYLHFYDKAWDHFDGLMPKRSNSSVVAMELRPILHWAIDLFLVYSFT